MDLEKQLFGNKKRKAMKGAAPASIALHGLLIAAIMIGGARAKHSVAAENKIDAFITQGAAPPPPPPPPPPKKASGGGPKPTPKVQQPKPVTPQPRPTFVAPVEIPKELPKVEPLPVKNSLPVPDLPEVETVVEDTGAGEGGDAVNGVVGGVEGGVAGGVVGGQTGGVLGGQIGGVEGGVVGGKVGGTGTGTEGTGTGGNEAPVAPEPPPPPPPPPPPVPDGPLRVGGDVKAPVTLERAQPEYTDAARKAKVAGVVVVEAIIDERGNVDNVKVIKGLPAGLSDQAERAVRRWKFKPGTLNGKPVSTIFNLTVTFKLE